MLLLLFAPLLVTCAKGSPSELEVDSYVETFAGLLGKDVTLESLTHLADNCDYYANMSAIGGRVIAESLHNDSTKSDPYLQRLRHKIITLWDRRARRGSDRKKRDTVSDIEELQKSMEQRFSDLMDHQSAITSEIASRYAWLEFDRQVTWKLSMYDYELTDVTTPDDYISMGERGLRQLCDSIDYRPSREEYWPNHALRLAKDVVGNSNVAVPEAHEVGRTYPHAAERILTNLTNTYPCEGYPVLNSNSTVAVGTASLHRNAHVTIFPRTPSSIAHISLAEFNGMNERIIETFKSSGTVLADGLRKLNSSMPELFADGSFANAYATRCHRSSGPAAWSTSPFTVTVDHYSGIFPFRRCAFVAFFP